MEKVHNRLRLTLKLNILQQTLLPGKSKSPELQDLPRRSDVKPGTICVCISKFSHVSQLEPVKGVCWAKEILRIGSESVQYTQETLVGQQWASVTIFEQSHMNGLYVGILKLGHGCCCRLSFRICVSRAVLHINLDMGIAIISTCWSVQRCSYLRTCSDCDCQWKHFYQWCEICNCRTYRGLPLQISVSVALAQRTEQLP